MRARPPSTTLLAIGLLVVIVALGVGLRLEEPLSSPALGAEDPYTHVVLTKEALERGWFGDSMYLGITLYPPGLHAFAGVVAPLAGVSLYDFARFAPVTFGALAIVGMFVLVNRLAGPPAGLAAALVTAVMPEHVFRSNLLFPTALDLALLPGYLLLFHYVQEPGERQPWASALFLLATVPIAWMHPWAVPLFVAPALAYAMLRAIREEPAGGVLKRMLLPAAVATVGTAFAMASRWDESDTGFAGFLAHMGPLARLAGVDLPALLLFALLLIALGSLTAMGVAAAAALAYVRAVSPRALRIALGVAGGLAVVAVVWQIGSGHLPLGVNYFHNFGAVTILLALVGGGLALAAPSRAGDLGLVIGLALFPLTAFNPFESQFWPPRTVVYLGVGVAILAGSAVGWSIGRATEYFARGRASRIVAPVAVLASVLLVGGAMAAHPPSTYSWYRLYTDDEFAVLERLAQELDRDGDARAVVYSWQPGVVLRALGEPDQPRYAPKFYTGNDAEQAKVLGEKGSPKFVVVDKYVEKAIKQGKQIDLSFLEEGYRLADQNERGTIKVYVKEGS